MKHSDITDKSFGQPAPTTGTEMAFIPNKLPPQLEWSSSLVAALSDATLALGQLHGASLNLPNPNLLITPFLRREAEMSSRIEGTQAELGDIYLFEMQEQAAESKAPDVKEVANYVRAVEYGLNRIGNMPVCLRMIRELHEILLSGVRGAQRMPGQFRKVQNWIGSNTIEQAIYVPPPPEKIPHLLDDFEKFINAPLGNLPVLVWLPMIHYQFEAIHPFLDGNGRIGRVLTTLLLCEKDVLDKPLLYLSAYFERNRQEYYDRLLNVSTRGQWTEWISFFLRGITEQSLDAFERSRQLMELQQRHHSIVHRGKGSGMLLRLVDLLIERPIVTTVYVSKTCNTSYMTARNGIARLLKAGILKEVSGRKRNKIYLAPEVLEIINRPFGKD